MLLYLGIAEINNKMTLLQFPLIISVQPRKNKTTE